MMETFIVLTVVAMAVVYLVKRYLRIFRPRADDNCECGCSDCGQTSTCTDDVKSIQPRP